MVINFQALSKKTGDEFEKLVLEDLENKGFSIINRNVYMPRTGCEVDFVAVNSTENIIWHVEAKGGKHGDKKRPGAQRTDSVKKSIANASLIKTLYPHIHYVSYFSAPPKRGSYSEEMIALALLNRLFDDVIYLREDDGKDN